MKKYKKLKNGIRKVSLIIACLSIFCTSNIFSKHNVIFADKDDWQYIDEDCKEEEEKESVDDFLSDSSGEAWLTKGTEQYEVAKKVFEHLTADMGLSGAAAAGIMANIRGESEFIPDLAERSYWSDKSIAFLRFGMNSKIPPKGAGCSFGRTHGSYFGGGLFQFTPFTKFTDSKFWARIPGSDGWAPENQIDFMWHDEFADKKIMFYVSSMNEYYGAARYGFLPPFMTIEAWLSTTNPVLSSRAFQVGYERPAKYHSEREDFARAANTIFNPDNIKADPSKWKFDDDVDIVNTNSKDNKNTKCGKKEKTGDFAVWGNDGTGMYDGSEGTGWRKGHVPAKLKKYALDPESLGIGYLISKNWTNTGSSGYYYGNQCVNFASTFFNWLWQKKDGSYLLSARGSTSAIGIHDPNGRAMAKSFSKAYCGKFHQKKVPRKGAISGVPAKGYGPGHTYIVSHVFANGDILIVEQNWPHLSGQLNGERFSWDYRFIKKEKYMTDGTEFYCPINDGYKPNPKIKTVP